MIITTIILAIICFFTYLYMDKFKRENKIIQNLEKYAKKEEIKQQKSKVFRQKSFKQTNNKEKSAQLYN